MFVALTRWEKMEVAGVLRTRSPVWELMVSSSCAAVQAKKVGPVVELFENAVMAFDDLGA